jgi:uncharacterized protein YcfJ
MHNTFIIGTIAALVSVINLTSPSRAETRTDSVLGTVIEVDTLTSSYVRKTPRDERSCEVKDVPIYSEAKENNEIGSMIIGGLLGSALGNKLSDSNGAGSAGAVAGALIGRDRAKKQSNNGTITGYRQTEVCSTRKVVFEEVVEKITGYRVQVEADGRILSFNQSRSLNIGERVEIRKTVSYSIK